MAKYLVICFALLAVILVKADDCTDKTTCGSCVKKSSWLSWLGIKCRWCPLSRRCHTFGAVATNPCSSSMNMEDTGDCPSTSGPYGTYDRQLAYEQALLSTLAYADAPYTCKDRMMTNGVGQDIADWEIINLIAIECDNSLFKYKECAAIIARSHRRQSIFVSFRGTTEPSQLIDEILDVLSTPQARLGKGHVQEYFLNAFNKLSPCIESKLIELQRQNPTYRVRISGHSLGGALASIAAYSFIRNGTVSKDKLSLYTFGMPRVGDKLYAADHSLKVKDSWRIVHYKDCVPHFPSCIISCVREPDTGPYHHRTEVHYDSSYMVKTSSYRVCHSNEDEACSAKYHGWIKTPSNILSCSSNHKKYFNMPIGTYCEEIGSDSRAFGHLLRGNQCSALRKVGGSWISS